MFSSYLRKTLTTLFFVVSAGSQASIIYSDRASFEASLENLIIDDYSNPAYRSGDKTNGNTLDVFTDAAMSAVFGETIYQSTGFSNLNAIIEQSNGAYAYCAGCNGSFLLDFTSTSVGTDAGVFGVGLNVAGYSSSGVYGTTAFVTFGDGSTENFVIPEASDGELPFWGITSDAFISTIHFGLQDGATNTLNAVQRMALDNLTIGDSAVQVPSPAIIWLLLAGIAMMQVLRRR